MSLQGREELPYHTVASAYGIDRVLEKIPKVNPQNCPHGLAGMFDHRLSVPRSGEENWYGFCSELEPPLLVKKMIPPPSHPKGNSVNYPFGVKQFPSPQKAERL